MLGGLEFHPRRLELRRRGIAYDTRFRRREVVVAVRERNAGSGANRAPGGGAPDVDQRDLAQPVALVPQAERLLAEEATKRILQRHVLERDRHLSRFRG